MSIPAADGYDLSALDDFTASIGGKQPATWTIWVQWGSLPEWRREFPTTTVDALKAKGVTPMIWWEPMTPTDIHDGWFPRYKNIINGKHDRYIRRFAKAAAAHDGPIILRFAHEANQGWFPWGVGRFDNTKKNFKRAWRRIWRIFRDQGALDNVKFLWSVARQSCRRCNNPYTKSYPGTKFVDYVGFTALNWGGKGWKSMEKTHRQPMRYLRKLGKPIIVAENASHWVGGDKATWIRNGYDRVYKRKRWGRIRAIVYFNTDAPSLSVGQPDWRLIKPDDGSALRAYASIASKRRFQGSVP